MPVAADTHALIWYLTSDPTLSMSAETILDAADAGLDTVLIPTAVIVEAIQIAGRRGVPLNLLQLLLIKIDVPTSGFEVVDLDRTLAEDTIRLQGTNVGNPIDRIVASTSMVRAVDLLTRDGYICQVLTNIIST